MLATWSSNSCLTVCLLPQAGPSYGRRMMTGYLAANGIQAAEGRVGQVLQGLQPRNHVERQQVRPNIMYCNDSNTSSFLRERLIETCQQNSLPHSELDSQPLDYTALSIHACALTSTWQLQRHAHSVTLWAELQRHKHQ